MYDRQRETQHHLHLNSLRIFLILLGLTFLASSRVSSSPQIQISTSPLSRKIQQPTITAILRDQQSFLWIGTQQGLYRFDGVSPTKFSSESEGNSWIPSSNIRRIVEDANGRIFVVSSNGGLIVSDSSKQSFTTPAVASIKAGASITDLVISTDGTLWASGEDGLFWYDDSQSSFVKFDRVSDSNNTPIIAADTDSSVYIAYDSNLYRISNGTRSITKIKWLEGDKADYGRITALAFDNTGSIFIGTDSGFLAAISSSGAIKHTRMVLSEIAANSITDLLFFHNSLWIGTTNGLYYTDRYLGFLIAFLQDNSDLASSHITALFDDDDTLWVGTFHGLNTASFKPFDTFSQQNSQIFNDVLTFEEDMDGNLWVGTFNGLFLYDELSGTHKRFQGMSNLNELTDQRIMTMSATGKLLWLGFRKNGVQIVDTKSLAVTTPTTPILRELEVTKIVHAKSGSTWIASFTSGLYRVNGEAITSYFSRGIPENSVTIILQTSNGEIFAGSEHTIYRYDESRDDFSRLALEFHPMEENLSVLSVSESANGDLWISTKDEGIFIWEYGDRLSDKLKPFSISKHNQQTLSTVYQVQFDTEGYAWCSTQSGIAKLDPSGRIMERFSASDGLQGSDFNFGSSYKDSNGRIYFGGSNGYNRFLPTDIHIDRKPPRIIKRRVGVSKDGGLTYFDATTLNEIQLTYKDYFVQFEFSVLDFKDPERNQYRYILDGFDHDWIENGTRNTATYTSLPPGDYVLRVQGANSAGVWNREGLSLAVKVFPPPWRTWWAYTLYAIILAFLLWLGKRAYDSYVIEKRAREMALVMIASEERADDEMQEQLEIHDDLVKSVYRHSVSTLNLVGDVLSIRGGQLIDENAREVIAQSIERVQALALLEECLFYQNEVLLADLNKYTNILVSNLLQKSATDEQHITTINEVSARPLPIEQASPLAIALYELLENAIVHAFDESSEANYIHVILATEAAGTQDAGHHRLTVQDDGAGIPSNIDPLSSHTPGFVIVASMAQKLSAELSFAFRNGTLVSMVFPQQEAR
ncbi:MAG: hypothetical protein H6987_13525 [Pseudomonadales bacterium]|nr:hypothetical protein [Pseudomonadales bacterium]